MKIRFVVALLAIALVSSGLTYAILRVQQNNEGLGYDTRIDLLELQISNLNSSLTLLDDRLHSMNVSVTRTFSDLQAIADKFNLTQEDVQSLKTSINGAQANIATIQGTVGDLQLQLSTIQDDLETAQTEMTDIQTQMTSLSADVSTLETQVTEVVADVTTILTDISNIQVTVSSLQSKIADLNSSKSIVIRVWIQSFTTSDLFGNPVPNNVISNVSGEDWLIDAQVTWKGSVISQARTGHSRFFTPKYIDLSIPNFNRTQFVGQNVRIELVAYWHAQDAVIDINPTHDHSWNTHWDWINNKLSVDYTVGSEERPVTITGDGYPKYIEFTNLFPNVSRWYSYATMTYRIETF